MAVNGSDQAIRGINPLQIRIDKTDRNKYELSPPENNRSSVFPSKNYRTTLLEDALSLDFSRCRNCKATFSSPNTDIAPANLAIGESPSSDLTRRPDGRLFLYGVGREGLMLKALCIRLAHLGLSSHQTESGSCVNHADVIFYVPAQSMADDEESTTAAVKWRPLLPMG
ncbi:hypothetical protein SDJN02_22405, partial [Cucurbita argyrosperma subsp. argyrosperma]